jgi:hypothetical protein
MCLSGMLSSTPSLVDRQFAAGIDLALEPRQEGLASGARHLLSVVLCMHGVRGGTRTQTSHLRRQPSGGPTAVGTLFGHQIPLSVCTASSQ